MAKNEAPTEALTELLQNTDSSRIALYLPEIWLPTREQSAYREAYLDAWWDLLKQTDQAADFIDGDIGEMDSQEPRELVVKAAHLAPSLLRADLLTQNELSYIYQNTTSDTLQGSIRNTLTKRPVEQAIQLNDVPARIDAAKRFSENPEHTPKRQQWLFETAVKTISRTAARTIDMPTAELLMQSTDSTMRIIALRALARFGRHGTDISSLLPTVEKQLQDNDPLIRRQAVQTYRHLYHSGILNLEDVTKAEVAIPLLSGELSTNVQYMSKELNKLKHIAETLASDPDLATVYYPVVLLGGSRIKGYGEAESDIDTTVVVRPNQTPIKDRLKYLFGNDLPIALHLKYTQDGLRIEDVFTNDGWSHLIYSTVWIGDSSTIDALRSDLTKAYSNDIVLRHVALRRIEQDSLQYRLLHKGYEQHYAVQADDRSVPDESAFWDPGYRKMATQLFAEKVRLPNPE